MYYICSVIMVHFLTGTVYFVNSMHVVHITQWHRNGKGGLQGLVYPLNLPYTGLKLSWFVAVIEHCSVCAPYCRNKHEIALEGA